MSEHRFSDRDHLAWSRFMLLNVALAGMQAVESSGGNIDAYLAEMRATLSRAWSGLGAQGVEGAMLSMILTLESMGSVIKSTQTSPENSEIVVGPVPGETMLIGMQERFDVQIDPDAWYQLFGSGEDTANRIYDLLGAIADGAGVEFLREETDEGDIRLVLRAW